MVFYTYIKYNISARGEIMEENFKNESMVDVAFSTLNSSAKGMDFYDLYKTVSEKAGFTKEQSDANIATFYSNLSLDGRFVNLGDNLWDLRARQTYDKVHFDMNDVYSDIEEEVAGNTDVEELDDEEKKEEGISEETEDGTTPDTEDDGSVVPTKDE